VWQLFEKKSRNPKFQLSSFVKKLPKLPVKRRIESDAILNVFEAHIPKKEQNCQFTETILSQKVYSIRQIFWKKIQDGGDI
jgi:hypothetical protein